MDQAMTARPGLLRRLAPFVTLGVLPFLIFWRLTLGLDTLARGDFLEQNYPLRLFAARAWGMGQLPLWNPLIAGGQPSLADFLTCALYPLNLLAEWLTLPWGFPLRALEFEVLVHLGMAGIFTFLFVRQILASELAALVAGLIFALGGYATSFPMEQNHILESAVWLPVILWFLELAFVRRNLMYYLGAGVALGVCLLAGHPQTVLYMGLCFGLYWLWRWLERPDRRHLLGLVYMGLVTAMLSLPQLLPFAELAAQTTRASMDYTTAASGLAPQELWALLAPFHGGTTALYVGLSALVLAPLALGVARWRRQTVFWAFIAVCAVLLGMGANGPLYPLFHEVIPGIGLVRQQERTLVVFALAMGILSGAGVKALLDQPLRRGLAAAGLALTLALGGVLWALWSMGASLPEAVANVLPRLGVFFGLTAVVLVWLAVSGRRRTVAVALLVVLLATDLATANTHTAVAPSDVAHAPVADAMTKLTQQAAADGVPFRVSSEGLLSGDGNQGIWSGVEDVVSSTPMRLSTYDALLEKTPEWTWWHLMNVRFIATKRTLTHGALAQVAQQGDVRFYELYGWQGRAWFVQRATRVSSPAAALALVSAADFPTDRRAAIERGPSVSGPDVATPVRVSSLDNGGLRLQVNTGGPGYLLISQNYYPGWMAWVDGRPSPVYRANGWQPAVYLTAGAHSVQFSYLPLSLVAGLVGSLVCFCMLLVLLRRGTELDREISGASG